MFVTTYDDLKAFCVRAQNSDVLAVDTEFLRERTYHPHLCLIQLAISDSDIVAVDPIAIKDLSPLVELFENPAITKIFHACGQDLEVIDATLGCIPAPIFDTQVAAAFLGHRMQLGYGPLVEAYEEVHLAKAESLTDWSRRPLDPEQLSYAEDDVRYLPGIYYKMVEELIVADRLNWVMPEMQTLIVSEQFKHEPKEAYLHLKRAATLTRTQLGVAREVCAWREKTAENRDIPRKWVISDEVVIEICKRVPKDAQRLHRIRGAEQLSERDTDAILNAVVRAKACKPEDLPPLMRKNRPSAEQESVLDLMYAMLRIISENSGVATQLIATRDELYSFMLGNKDAVLNEGWRFELAGKKLQALLSGSMGLTIKEGRVEIL